MKLNTNSNSYTIIYASVIVVIVAFALAFVSSSLKETQKKNEDYDKMKQILSAIHVDASKAADVQAEFDKYIKADEIMNSEAQVLAEKGGFLVDMKFELAKDLKDRQLPVYIAEVDGQTKYILPLFGAGLWNSIWGYIALNEDKNTVFGVYFDHAGETPGLGAEIATDKFQGQFNNKHVYSNGEVALSVVKNGKVTNKEFQIDGLSGGTITSNGVDAMLKKCISQYNKFLNN